MGRARRAVARRLWSAERVRRALAGGLVGTVVMTVLVLLFEVQTREQLRLFDAIARFFGVPENVALGFAAFLFFGLFAWPLLFALLEPTIPFADPAVAGMAFATALWIGFLLVGTAEIVVVVLPFYAAVTLVAHLAYGFALGLVFDWDALATDDDPHEPNAPADPSTNDS